MSANSALRMQRIKCGLTQAELARKADVSQQLLSKMEAGTIRVSPDRAQSFSVILGCSVLDLMPSFAGKPAPKGYEELELLQIFRDLDPEKQSLLISIARSVAAEGQARNFTQCANAN